jgi:hypothetical protein
VSTTKTQNPLILAVIYMLICASPPPDPEITTKSRRHRPQASSLNSLPAIVSPAHSSIAAILSGTPSGIRVRNRASARKYCCSVPETWRLVFLCLGQLCWYPRSQTEQSPQVLKSNLTPTRRPTRVVGCDCEIFAPAFTTVPTPSCPILEQYWLQPRTARTSDWLWRTR